MHNSPRKGRTTSQNSDGVPDESPARSSNDDGGGAGNGGGIWRRGGGASTAVRGRGRGDGGGFYRPYASDAPFSYSSAASSSNWRSGHVAGRNNQQPPQAWSATRKAFDRPRPIATASAYASAYRSERENGGQQQLSSELSRFCDSIHEKVLNGRAVELKGAYDLKLWKTAFDIGSTNLFSLRPDLVHSLLRAYLSLPDATNFAPFPVHVLKMLESFMERNSRAEDILLIKNVITQRLQRSSSINSIGDTQRCLQVLSQVSSFELKLFQKMSAAPDFNQIVGDVSGYHDMIKHKMRKALTEIALTNPDENENAAADCLVWAQSPTVGWLTSANWLDATGLRSSYDDVEQYISVVQNTWTLLTFYWGTAALWPHCHFKPFQAPGVTTDQICGVPLLSKVQNDASCTMRLRVGPLTKVCGNQASWRCMRQNHDAICDECLESKKEGLVGPPHEYTASTDVYDAECSSVVIHGDNTILLLRRCLSRKPPKVDVNWRTSYRLQSSCLVGVVDLPASGMPIRSDYRIYFGEIVKHDKKVDDRIEYDRRSRGDLAIRLLSRSDCQSMKTDSEVPFRMNGFVAVIDMRVFVPEVVSVLSTLVNPSFKDGLLRLSFREKLLDFRRNIIPDSNPDAGQGKASKDSGASEDSKACEESEGDSEDAPDIPKTQDSVTKTITDAVKNSLIPVIRDLSPADKEYFIHKILSIPAIKTLDETQAAAFGLGLSTDLHCTQGPPGTGKSYVGVCLVLAFVELRDMMRLRGKTTGPVVVLSYKNHALDEFLIDVQKASRELVTRHGSLIRLGAPERPELMDYTESSSAAESDEFRELQYRVDVVKRGRWLFQNLMNSISISGTLYSDSILYSIVICRKLLNDENAIMNPADAFRSIQQLLDRIKSAIESPLNDFCLENLFKLAEHWISNNGTFMTSVEILSRWLGGGRPPPRCEAVIDVGDEKTRCINYASAYSHFCQELHSCRLCPNQRVSQHVPFCQNHKCRADDGCRVGCLPGKSFCLIHTCPVCIEKPRFGEDGACHDHLCIVTNCQWAQLSPFNFCPNHCCQICMATSSISADSICASNAYQKFSRFCSNHKCRTKVCLDVRVSKSGAEYCDVHACVICGQQVDLTAKNRKSKLCPNHRCSHDENTCIQVRVVSLDGRKSLFCSWHTCMACVQLGFPLNRQVFKPRNTCSEHVLCQHVEFKGARCFALLKPGQTLCPAHGDEDDDSQCAGKTVKNVRCKASKPFGSKNIGGKWYCPAHQNQRSKDQSNAPAKKDEIVFIDFNAKNFQSLPPLMSAVVDRKVVMNLGNVLPILQCNFNHCPLYCVTGEEKPGSWMCALHVFISHMQTGNGRVDIKVDPEPAPLLEVLPPQGASLIADESPAVVNNADESKEAVRPLKAKPKKRKFALEDSNIMDAAAGSGNPDEDEIVVDVHDGDGLFVNEQVEHNKLIYKEDADDDDEANLDEAGDVEQLAFNTTRHDVAAPKVALEECEAWSWEMSVEDRRKSSIRVIESASHCLARLISKSEDYVEEQRQRKAEANAMTLKEATVIGGTVVGAARRLTALRASEPFAIVVEEACEVMEPTLVAVLAVESVQKLELIGDHRQLPAFVNQCWFNLELSMKSIKISLFERLVKGDSQKPQGLRTCSILDVQRRMRPCIADLTRQEYADIIEIKDHECTVTQKVGNRNVVKISMPSWSNRRSEAVKSCPLQKMWFKNGRSVPGVQSAIYFWDMLNNETSQPKVGLSACNENEANAVAQLTKYLLFCGVPPSAITIITPYQGQRREIVEELRKQNCLPPRDEEQPQSSIVISTVDRYQGDENDIVILSLVRTRPGNRFVTLPNRFIVAASRARLGFYIIGSVEAVVETKSDESCAGAQHWVRFVNRLKEPDNTGCDSTWQSKRIGHILPLCCPDHGAAISMVSSLKEERNFPTADTWDTFCSLPCQSLLRCGHPCSLPCHVNDRNAHEAECKIVLPRPCERHAEEPLLCGDLKIGVGQTLEGGLQSWKCSILNAYSYPDCAHSVDLKCSDYDAIVKGRKEWPPCQHDVEDFIHPQCQHVFSNLHCHQRRKYETKTPLCYREESVELKCGHELVLKCHQRLDSSFVRECKESGNFPRPRCNHILSIPCRDNTKLREWWNQNHYVGIGDDNAVKEGYAYGKPESSIKPTGRMFYSSSRSNLDIPVCKAEMPFERSCGHIVKMMCSEAFECASNPAKLGFCQVDVPIKCPLCRCLLPAPCHIAARLDTLQLNVCSIKDDDRRSTTETAVKNLQLTQETQQLLLQFLKEAKESNKCSTQLSLISDCGQENHVESVTCVNVLEVLLKLCKFEKCTMPAQRLLDCGHSQEVECVDLDKLPPPLCLEKADAPYIFEDCGHAKYLSTCDEYHRFKADATKRCVTPLKLTHYRCGHPVDIACGERLLVTEPRIDGEHFQPQSEPIVVDEGVVYCKPYSTAPSCKVLVEFKRTCGHVVKRISCNEAFAWADKDKPVPECLVITSMIHPLCGHEVTVPCWLKAEAFNWNPWPEGDPVTLAIAEGKVLQYPFEHPPSLNHLAPQIHCPRKIFVSFAPCSHTSEINCHDAFTLPKLKCPEVVARVCPKPNCGASLNISCHELLNLSPEQLDRRCVNKVQKLCSKCNMNQKVMPCNEPLTCCGLPVEAKLPCEHTVEWKCGSEEDPRPYHDIETGRNSKCIDCVIAMWEDEEAFDITAGALVDDAKSRIEEILQDNKVIECLKLRINAESFGSVHENSRKSLISRFGCSISAGKVPLTLPMPIDTVQNYIRSRYEVVYFVGQGKQEPDMLRQMECGKTNYGRGIKCSVFLKSAIEKLTAQTGSVQVGIALAFTGRAMQNAKPFSGGKGKKIGNQADQTASASKKMGYSCVVSSCENDKPLEYVFWEPSLIVPLFNATLQMRGKCAICFNFKPKNRANGAICEASHFVCWTCISDHLEELKNPDAIDAADKKGNLCCQVCEGRKGYDILKILPPPHIGEALVEFKMRSVVNKKVAQAQQEEAARYRKQIEELQTADEIVRLRHQIIEEILTPKCPGCNKAFIDFNGCFALTCGCGTKFCAWCLTACAGNPHTHVASCRLATIPGVFGDIRQLQDVWNNIRKDQIRELLRGRSRSKNERLLQAMKTDFDGIGLKIQLNEL